MGRTTRRATLVARLTIARTEDVPLMEVSGVCLPLGQGGNVQVVAVVAVGDRAAVGAWATIRKPEGLALTPAGRATVALDTPRARRNLVLLDPAIAPPAGAAASPG